jgi:beta-adrenergic-receptor kinase
MAHPWFKNLTWEAIISDRKRPQYIPPKDVNAASQSEIGTFAEEKSSLEVTESDDKIYNQWLTTMSLWSRRRLSF